MKILILFTCLLSYVVSAQTNISGVINSYIDVTNISVVSNSVNVSSTVNFSVGDKVLLIQMQGATIDETQNSTFGSIIDYGNAGNYEFLTICNISANTIHFSNTLLNTYNTTGNVQLITVPTYTNALISGADLTANPWDGAVGGVLVLEVDGVLDFGSQNINVDGLGFSGGQAIPSGNGCVFLLDDSYYSNLTSGDETALKGDGIATQITTKECGRGPQANGGGGGNNHNGGGGGGANYGFGGSGGQRVKSSPFTCGSVVGINSKNLSVGYINQKIFLGGGGGAGHGNNAGIIGESGLNGAGIVIIKANSIQGNGNSISANGISVAVNSEGEGAGGGGAGGTVYLDVLSINSNLIVNTNGSNGVSVENIGTSNCNGPGGGGGGGLIRLSSALANMSNSVNGGNAGVIVTTSQSGCTVGSTNGGQNGEVGAVLTDLLLNESVTNFNSSTLTATACKSYVSPSGIYTWTTTNIYNDTIIGGGSNGCDSIIIVDLTINNVDVNVSNLAGVLTANMAGETYQWLNCNDNFSPISGATNQSYTPTENGDYAVLITTADCNDTSACNNVSGMGVFSNSFKNNIDIFPNPTYGNVIIDLNDKYRNITVFVRTIDGKLIATHDFKNESKLNVYIEGPKAYYVIEVVTKKGYRAMIKVLKM